MMSTINNHQTINIKRIECLTCSDKREHHLPLCDSMLSGVYFQTKNHSMPSSLSILSIMGFSINVSTR